MGEPATEEPSRLSTASLSSSPSNHTPSPPPPSSSLVEPSITKRKGRPEKVIRVMRSVFRSFPIITHPVCKFPSIPYGARFLDGSRGGGGSRVTGTLFGYRKGRVSLSIQESPGTLPMLVVEMAMQTYALQKEMSNGMVRIAMECEKRPTDKDTKMLKLLEEPVWTMFCNGKKLGYGKKREATEEDLGIMESLKVVSMGAGVLPGKPYVDGQDGEIAYVRAHFDRTVGSKDSETLYMISPDVNNGPELSIFFVRL